MNKSILTYILFLAFGFISQSAFANNDIVCADDDLNLNVRLDINNESCLGGNDGAAAAQPDGGLPPYTYLWNTGATTQIITGLVAGPYSVTVTDAAGATATASGIVEKGYIIHVPTNANYETCDGSMDAEAAVFPEGGVQPYSYLWNDPAGQTTFTATGLSAGTYLVTVTDGNGCSNVASVTVETSPEGIWIMTSSTPTTCHGGNDGTAHVSIMTGTAPFITVWDDPAMQTGTDPVGLAPGTYGVTVTDANGCEAIGSVTIGEAPEMGFVSQNSTPADCGSNNGTASVQVFGGTPGYTYLWNDPAGQTSATATGLAAGTYSVVVTDANGCQINTSVVVEQSSGSINLNIDALSNVTCNGANDGSATIGASGGTSPYSFVWNEIPGLSGATATGLAAGTYTVVVTGTNGCSNTISVTITEPSALSASFTTMNSVCGAATGSATVNVSGGTASYTYLWSDAAGQTSAMATGLAAGAYSVTVTDANNCQSIFGPVTIGDDCGPEVECSTPVISSLVVIESSCGNSNGSATIEMVGGNSNYTFAWTPTGGSQNAATGLAAGTYTVVITDVSDAACTITEVFTVGNADGPTPVIVSTTPATCNEFNGTATLGPIGLQFAWCDGTVGNNAISLPVGACAVTVTDPNTGCFNVVTVNIEEFIPLTASATINAQPSCGIADGAVSIVVEMGSFDYSYNWSDGGSGVSRNDLAAGTYTVTVTDNGPTGCVTTTTFTLINDGVSGAEVNIQSDPVLVTCIGDSDGNVEYDITYAAGFVNPPSVFITNGGGTVFENGSLAPGEYCINVVDGNGCFAAFNCFSVVEPEQIDLDIAILPAGCDMGGTITITDVRGGNGGYTFDWGDLAGSDNSMDRAGIAEGTYNLTVTDSKGCSVSVNNLAVGRVCEPTCDTPVISSIVVIESTCGNAIGSATIQMVGGNDNYSFDWSPAGGSENAATGLEAGTYTVIITDLSDAACTITEVFTVGNADGPVPEILSTTPATCNESNGTATLGPIGLEFRWCDGTEGNNAIGLPAGTCAVTVTDPATNCFNVVTINIEEFNPLTASPIFNTLPDCGSSNGSVSIEVGMGSFDYSFEWSDGGSGADRNDLSAGTYTVTVTDNGPTGCVTTTTFTLLNGGTTGATVNITNNPVEVTCIGDADGEVIFDVVLSPDFDGPEEIQLVNNNGMIVSNGTLSPGEYCINVLDAMGCFVAAECFTVVEPDQIDVDVAILPADCDAGGTITITDVRGGNGGYVFDWADLSGTDNSMNRAGLAEGVYNLTVTDSKGCFVVVNTMAVEDVCVPCPPPIIASVVVVEANCGESDGLAAINMAEGNENFSFEWSPNVSNTGSANGISSGAYSVTITSLSGLACTIIEDFSVGTINGLGSGVETVRNASCGGADGFASLSPASFTYTWIHDGVTGAERSDLAEGTYIVEIMDPNNSDCLDAITVVIGSDNPLIITPVVNVAPDCGDSNGSVTLDIEGGSGDYSFSWGTGATQTNLAGGQQMVMITDNVTGCQSQTNFTLNENVPVADVVIEPQVNTSCPGSEDGFVELNNLTFSPGFVQPATVRIEDVDGNQFTNGELIPGDYCVIVRDGNGCIAGSNCFRVRNAPQIDVDIELFNQQCSAPGMINLVDVSGGNGDFEFNWMDIDMPEEPQNRDSIGAAEYTIVVSDSEGCMVSQALVIEDERYDLDLETESDNVSCNGSADGSIDITPSEGIGPYTFDWNIDENEGSIDELEPGTYEVTVTDANECTAESSFIIQEPVPLEIDLGNDTMACASSIVIGLPDNPGSTYTWTDSDGMEIGNESTIDVSPAGTSTYYLAFVDGNGCMAMDSINVMAGDLDADFGFNLDACSDVAEISLSDQSSSNFDPISSWSWSLSNGMESELQNPTFTVDSSQSLDIVLTIETTEGCIQTITQSFEVDPVDVIVPDASECMNVDEVQLNEINANSNYTFAWDQDGTLDNPNIPNPISTATENTTYTVTITNEDGTCEVEEMVNVNFYENVDVNASGNQTVCEESEVDLEVTSSNATTFNWFTDQGTAGNGSTISVGSGPAGAEETYYVEAVDGNGCSAIDTVLVSNRSIIFELDQEQTIVCEDEQYTVEPIGGLSTEGFNFNYFPPEIVSDETTIESEPIIAPIENTFFVVEASNEYGCATSDSIFVTVSRIDDNVEALADPPEIIAGQTSQLSVDNNNGLIFEWDNETTLDDPTLEDPLAMPEETTSYKVIVINEDGCAEERTVTVVVRSPDCAEPFVFVPNAFSPNDDGMNDVFRIRGELYITESYLVVYSRWGEKMFESDNINTGWDGSFKGEDLCSDVYAYYYRVVCNDGQELEGKGNVSLLR